MTDKTIRHLATAAVLRRKKACPRCCTKVRPRQDGTLPPHEFKFGGPNEVYWHWVTCDGTREGFDRATDVPQ